VPWKVTSAPVAGGGSFVGRLPAPLYLYADTYRSTGTHI
jgi:hypothetical protein